MTKRIYYTMLKPGDKFHWESWNDRYAIVTYWLTSSKVAYKIFLKGSDDLIYNHPGYDPLLDTGNVHKGYVILESRYINQPNSLREAYEIKK